MAVPNLRHYSRDNFVNKIFNVEPGEHVTIVGSTGSGKTTLGHELLGATASKHFPVVALQSKPKDSTTAKAARKYGLRVVRRWPPPKSLFQPKDPRGWVVQPRFTYDDDVDVVHHEDVFRATMRGVYRDGNRTLYASDLYGLLLRMPRLQREYETAWLNWRSGGGSLWVDTQKSTHIPLLGFNQPTHLFLFRESDKRGRDRFNEIGGFDGRLVADANLGLERHQALYLNQADQTMCVVEA